MRFNLFVPCFLALLSVGIAVDAWLSGRASALQQQEARQQFVTQLAAALAKKPAFTDELLTAATDLCQCVQLRWQRQDGVAEFVAGSVTIPQSVLPAGWSQQQELPVYTIAIHHDDQLVAVFPADSGQTNWFQLMLSLLGLLAAGFASWLYLFQRAQQHQLAEQLSRLAGNESWPAADFAGQMQLLHVVEVEFLQRRQQEQDLRGQLNELTQQLHSQQTSAVQQAESMVQQLQSLRQDNHRWQLLAQQLPQLSSSRLVPLLTAFAGVMKGADHVPADAVQSFTSWYQQQFELAAATLDADNQLLPAEDPAICRAQVEVNYHQLTSLLHLLLELVRPQNRGPETLVGYQLFDEVRPCVALTLQYNGSVLPVRIKQILQQGPIAAPVWQELVAEFIYRLIGDLGGTIDIQELSDVGGRFTLKIPVRLIAKPEKKQCQNMLVYDNRECRQGLWRHSLQAVAEQLVMVSTFTQLWHTAKHRLTDMIVLHLREEVVSEQELGQLKTLAQRYPMKIFVSSAQTEVCRELAGVAKIRQTPVLLGAMCEHQMVDTLLAQQQLLVVDDNQTNLSFIRAMLTGMGLGIDFATSGQEALRLAEQTKYQLILMDIQLPDISGMEVTKLIRQLKHHQQTQVLAFTAHALPEEVASFKLAGMDDVLFKPLDERKIAHILQRLAAIKETS